MRVPGARNSCVKAARRKKSNQKVGTERICIKKESESGAIYVTCMAPRRVER